MALFAAPRLIETTVWARIPDALRIRDRASAWVDVQRPGQPTDCFIEGPVFDPQGHLYIVDIPYGRVLRIDPRGQVALIADYDGEPNGLARAPDGRLFIADHRRGLMAVHPDDGEVRCVLERDTMDHFKGLNDLVFASNGDLYFTDQGGTGWHDPTGRVYRLKADGRLERLLENVPSPNGLALTPDERTLLLAVTRANAVWRVPLLPGGGAFKVGTFLQLSGGVGPDGLAIDRQGRLVVAHFGMGCAWIFDPRGVPLYCVRSCAGLGITNVTFGPGDEKSLYLTESETGSVLRAQLP